jgi:hypothetical protein
LEKARKDEGGPFATQAEAVMSAVEETIDAGGGTITVCIGEQCPFSGEEAIENQERGCPMCERLQVDADGEIVRSKAPVN